jgi:hypothetical protein
MLASALLGVSSIAYAQTHRFPYHDPFPLKIFRSGILLYLGGIGFGISGVWRPSSLRWHAPASAVDTLSFRVVAASGASVRRESERRQFTCAAFAENNPQNH